MHLSTPTSVRPSCRFCGESLTMHQAASNGTCDRHPCRHQAALQAIAARRAKARALLMAGATRQRNRVAARLGLAASHELPIALVPASARRSTVLPASRRHLFRAHLETVLTRLAQTSAPSGAILPAHGPAHATQCHGEPPAVAAACATCRGHCCHGGGVKAYLDEETLLRFARVNPSLDSSETVRAYVSRLPRRSMKDSCVFHGEQGCTLPRDMRSATCNHYLCEGVRKLQPLDAAPVLIAAATDVKVVRSTVFANPRIAGALQSRPDHANQ